MEEHMIFQLPKTMIKLRTIDLSMESLSLRRFLLLLSAMRFFEGCPSIFFNFDFFSPQMPLLKTGISEACSSTLKPLFLSSILRLSLPKKPRSSSCIEGLSSCENDGFKAAKEGFSSKEPKLQPLGNSSFSPVDKALFQVSLLGASSSSRKPSCESSISVLFSSSL
ncbi:hypothetical protein Lal_00007318 [Lupinus albus]|nr:hypothetical protein Lal_00007318 [Lupinus albus]